MRSLCSPRMRAPIAAALACTAVALISCGGEDEPQRPPGRVQEVSNAIEEFEKATAAKDYERICTELFSEAVRKQAGGKNCPKLLAQTSADVRRPTITVLRIEVEGNRARARVRTRAAGQEPVTETLEMVREDGSYRVSALSR
jgi:hypothetical protein